MIEDDTMREDAEDFTITLSGNPVSVGTTPASFSYGTPNSVTVTIAANDRHLLAIADAADVSEGDEATFTVTLTREGNAVPISVTATWTATISGTMGGTPQPANGSLDFTSSQTSRDITVRIPANADLGDGDTRTLTVTIMAPDGVTETDAMGTATVNYRTAAHTVSLDAANPTTIAEGDAATFTVTRSGPALAQAVTIAWAVGVTSAGGDNDVDAADFGGAFPNGTVTFSDSDARQTFTITPAADRRIEMTEAFTVTLTENIPDAAQTANGTVALGTATADVSITDGDEAGLVISPMAVSVPEGGEAEYGVRLMAQPADAAAMVTVTVSSGDAMVATVSPASLMFTASNWDTAQTVTVMAHADAVVDATVTLTHTVSGSGEYANADGMLNATVTVTIVAADDPAARTTRVTTQLAGFAKAATQLTAQAVSQRLNFSGANTFNLGQADTAEDILRQSSFSLAHGNGGINLWAFGNRSNVSGDDNGVSYKGDATALHLGADTAWNNGLLGITIGQSAGDFTDTDTNSRLESSIVSVHPYLTRTVRGTKLWATIGYGTGEAELRETDGADTYRGDAGLSLLTAAASIALVVGDNAAFTAAAQWSKTEWDAATLTDANNRTRMLRKGDASNLRLDGGAELGKRFGDWRPFLTVNIRRDSGDGDDGNAADYGGGVEWQSSNVHLRLAGRKHAQGQGPDEEHITLTARKTAGKLNLGLNLSADDGINTGNLLTGELRF